MANSDGLTLKQIGNYNFLGKSLGKGNFARVELAEHRLTGAKVAVKVINIATIKEDYVRRNILREALIMKKVHHVNIIKLYETLKHNCLYCLVTELVKGGDLRRYVHEQKNKRLSEAKARSFFRQLLSAVKHLHENGIVHRDLKMDNILLDETKNVIKIVDFGLRNLFSIGELLKTHCGSPEYAAPELFEKGSMYGPSVDIWSMGVVLYAMVIGHLPFSTFQGGFTGKDELYHHAKKGLTLRHEKYLDRVSTGCRNLLGRILQPIPSRRISLDQMSQHKWITEDGRNPVIKQPTLLISKRIRDKVIDKVANLCATTASEAELRVKNSRHDAFCAIYNLLLDEAIKDRKQYTKYRLRLTAKQMHKIVQNEEELRNYTVQRTCSAASDTNRTTREPDRKSAMKAYAITQNAKAAEKSSLKESCKEGDSAVRPHKSQFSSVKIVEFTEEIKLEGRAKSPSVRQIPSAGRAWKTSRVSENGKLTTGNGSVACKGIETGTSKKSDGPEKEVKKQIFCSNPASNSQGCRITSFPEEDRSSRRPIANIRQDCSSPKPNHLTFTAGFNVSSSIQRLKLSSNRRASFPKEKENTQKVKTTRSLDNTNQVIFRIVNAARTTGQRESKESVASNASEAGRRRSNTRTQHRGIAQKRESSRLCQSKVNRFGDAFSELRRRSGNVLQNNRNEKGNNAVDDRPDKAKEHRDVDMANDTEPKDQSSEDKSISPTGDSQTFSSETFEKWNRSLRVQLDKQREQDEMINDGCEDTKTVTETQYDSNNEGNPLAEETRRDDSPKVYRCCSPQFRRYVSFLGAQRRVSLGILKTPSRSSSLELKNVPSNEKKKLKVTFKDEMKDVSTDDTENAQTKEASRRKMCWGNTLEEFIQNAE